MNKRRTATQKQRKITKVQRKILQILEEGQVITIDHYNMAYIDNRYVVPHTRYFLTDNRYVTRKDKTKSVETKGNGFIITEKGRKVLAANPPPQKRAPVVFIKKEKNCPDCGLIKPIEEFVTIYGFTNPRGKYCNSCFLEKQQLQVISIMEGRDFCLYCGVKIEKVQDLTPQGNSAHSYLHLDHMDPLSLGGEDSKNNTVFCCVSCNLKKKNKLFTKWLEELEPKYRKLSRRIYIEKHGRKPEKFEQWTNKTYDIVISIDLSDLAKKYLGKHGVSPD